LPLTQEINSETYAQELETLCPNQSPYSNVYKQPKRRNGTGNKQINKVVTALQSYIIRQLKKNEMTIHATHGSALQTHYIKETGHKNHIA
jgi:hypothetical protein